MGALGSMLGGMYSYSRASLASYSFIVKRSVLYKIYYRDAVEPQHHIGKSM